MKRLPLAVSFLVFIALCMSLSFWGLLLFKPQARNVSAAFQQNSYEPGPGQWGGLFGNSQVMQAATSNYQLKGVVLAKRPEESLAIVSTNGKPSLSVALNKELAPDVILKEVHDQYVLISESGVVRRLDLPQIPEGSRVQTQANFVNPANTVPPQVAPVAFPPHNNGAAPGGPISPSPPMVTPGLPTASLPATMPGGSQ